MQRRSDSSRKWVVAYSSRRRCTAPPVAVLRGRRQPCVHQGSSSESWKTLSRRRPWWSGHDGAHCQLPHLAADFLARLGNSPGLTHAPAPALSLSPMRCSCSVPSHPADKPDLNFEPDGIKISGCRANGNLKAPGQANSGRSQRLAGAAASPSAQASLPGANSSTGTQYVQVSLEAKPKRGRWAAETRRGAGILPSVPWASRQRGIARLDSLVLGNRPAEPSYAERGGSGRMAG